MFIRRLTGNSYLSLYNWYSLESCKYIARPRSFYIIGTQSRCHLDCFRWGIGIYIDSLAVMKTDMQLREVNCTLEIKSPCKVLNLQGSLV